jgi:hypothetical protein
MAGAVSTKLTKTMYAADWAANDPLLDEGEVGTEIDTGVLKVGDGTTRYSALPAQYPMIVITQAAYDALDPVNPNIVYFIVEE